MNYVTAAPEDLKKDAEDGDRAPALLNHQTTSIIMLTLTRHPKAQHVQRENLCESPSSHAYNHAEWAEQ